MVALQGSHDGEKILEAILREGRGGQNGVDGAAAGLFASRVQDKRLQLANQDRARFVARPDSLAHRQQAKRDRRVVKQRRRGFRQSSPARAAHESGEKGEECGPLSRRQRQRLGLEETDWNLTFESLAPIHQLWLDYIHRLLGSIDEKGAVQSNQFRLKRGIDGASDEVSMNANAVTAFQTSVVKADLCGAPMRVTRALNPSLVGIEGLVAKETESTLVIVTRSSHPDAKKGKKLIKTVPKHNTVFSLEIPLPIEAVPGSKASQQMQHHRLQATLYGNQLCNNMQTRATKKFKARKTVDL